MKKFFEGALMLAVCIAMALGTMIAFEETYKFCFVKPPACQKMGCHCCGNCECDGNCPCKPGLKCSVNCYCGPRPSATKTGKTGALP